MFTKNPKGSILQYLPASSIASKFGIYHPPAGAAMYVCTWSGAAMYVCAWSGAAMYVCAWSGAAMYVCAWSGAAMYVCTWSYHYQLTLAHS